MLILMLMPEKVCWWLNTTKFFPFPSGCPAKWFQRCDVIFRITFSKIPPKIITNNLKCSDLGPAFREEIPHQLFSICTKITIFQKFFPFTLRSENHLFWDVRVRNTCFLRSASLLVEKHFCHIHYSFSICHSCQVIDLLLMTSQKSLSEIKIQWKDTIEAKYQKSLHRYLNIVNPLFQEKSQ